MTSSISNWFTDQKIAAFAACMACAGFIGPGIFGLSPPVYFGPYKTEFERESIAQDSKALSKKSADRSVGTFKSVIEKTPSRDKDLKMDVTDPDPNLNDPNEKEQLKTLDTEKYIVENSQLDNGTTGDMVKLAQPLKPRNPVRIPKEANTRGVELKQTVQAAPLLVAREFVKEIPTSHQSLSGSAQKASFFKIALPLILAGNEEIVQRRNSIERANQNGDRTGLEKWAHLYDIKIIDQDNNTLTSQLLKRADVIPVPIALAQAAFESGWGTSRFAIKGNALFGQWAWRDDAGLRPLTPTNERAVVRSFTTLFGSVRAYIHNLNTHPYYEGFRNARAALNNRPLEKKTKVLVKYLDRYAEIGPAYVTKLEELIRTNNFGQYALADFY